ncbi:hypothetical protein TNCV_2623201 [Trichonephila clavipes]|nr:hypothetical protein TNCV_2623201 [Trichonephila clavipes]
MPMWQSKYWSSRKSSREVGGRGKEVGDPDDTSECSPSKTSLFATINFVDLHRAPSIRWYQKQQPRINSGGKGEKIPIAWLNDD